MSATLLIPRNPEADIWQSLHAGRAPDNLDLSAPKDSGQTSAVLLVPTEQVGSHETDIPVKQTGRARKLAPYSLEEQIAEPIEQTHFAIGGHRKNNKSQAGLTWTIAAVKTALMQQWDTRSREAGFKPVALYADYALLPYTSGHWTIWLDAGRAIVRTAEDSGFACPTEHVIAYLLAASAKHQDPKNQSEDAESEQTTPQQQIIDIIHTHTETIPNELSLYFEINNTRLVNHGLAELGKVHGHPLNLLQGAFSANDGSSPLRAWRWVIILSALLLISLAVQMGVETHQLKQELSQLKQENTALFEKAMPGSRMTDEPRFQVEQLLDKANLMRSPDPFFEQLSSIAKSLPPGVKLKRLNYADQHLHLTLQAPTAQSIAQFSMRLQAASIHHHMQNPQPEGKHYTATLKLGGQP